MTKKSLSRRLAIAAVSALAMVPVALNPARASVTIQDGSGVDYDAACAVPTPPPPPPPPNSILSPGLPHGTSQGGHGCSGTSDYDGSTESTDLSSVSLTTNGVDSPGPSDTQFVAECTMEMLIPLPGSTVPPGLALNPDLPADSFLGGSCKVMFQVPARQNTTPTNSVGGGAPREGGQMIDLHGHWRDGYHHFIAFDVQWDGTQWIHSAKVGTYDPLPTGGFVYTELGTNTGSGWVNTSSHAALGTNWNVVVNLNTVRITVDGVVATSCILCSDGKFNTVYVKAGDTVTNVKGLTTADRTSPVVITAPLAMVPGLSDVTTSGGFIEFSDTTDGHSSNVGAIGGASQQNISGIAYTPGPATRAAAGEWLGVFGSGPVPDEFTRLGDYATWGIVTSMPDTLGASPSCWTPTFGGYVQANPLFNPDIGCQYDDDNTPVPNDDPNLQWNAVDPGERGTFQPEFWDTPYSFVA